MSRAIGGRLRIIAPVALVAAVLVAGYLLWTPAAEREGRQAISAYNTALAQAIYDGSSDALSAVATPSEVQRVATYIILLKGTNQLIESDLVELEILSVDQRDGEIVVEASEVWRVTERARSTGAVVEPERIDEQVLRYFLVEQDDRLLVDRHEFIDDGSGNQ